MCKILKFPNVNQVSVVARTPITKVVALEEIKQLSWDDPEAFFVLGANCLSYQPVEMSERTKAKLEELNLVDSFGYSPEIVRSIMQSIMKRIPKTTIAV